MHTLCISECGGAMGCPLWDGCVWGWEGKKAQYTHYKKLDYTTAPVHQITSGEDKSWNKSIIKTFLTSTVLQAKIRVHNYTPSVKKCSGLNQERNLHRSSPNNFSLEELLWIMDSYFDQKQQVEWYLNGFVSYRHAASPDVNWWTGVVWCFYQTLILTAPIHCRASIDSHSDGTHSLQSIHWLSFWRHPFTAEHPLTLILTAPIHCRASIVETLMQCYISPNLMKKQTHLHLG